MDNSEEVEATLECEVGKRGRKGSSYRSVFESKSVAGVKWQGEAGGPARPIISAMRTLTQVI